MRNDAFRWQMLTYMKVTIDIFALVLTLFEILTFQMLELINFGKDHRAQQNTVLSFGGEKTNLSSTHFYTCFFRFGDKKVCNVLPGKFR